MIRWLLSLFVCQHTATYRERRRVGKAEDVLHLVCIDCGHARPTVDRTERDHKKVVRQSAALRETKANRKPAKVESIERRRQP